MAGDALLFSDENALGRNKSSDRGSEAARNRTCAGGMTKSDTTEPTEPATVLFKSCCWLWFK